MGMHFHPPTCRYPYPSPAVPIPMSAGGSFKWVWVRVSLQLPMLFTNWNMAKRVLRYLKGTRDMGIVYRRSSKTSDMNLEHATPWGYCDTNYVEDSCDCKSTSRYVFMLTGGPVAWKSKKQVSVALSTTEVEYYMVGITC